LIYFLLNYHKVKLREFLGMKIGVDHDRRLGETLRPAMRFFETSGRRAVRVRYSIVGRIGVYPDEQRSGKIGEIEATGECSGLRNV
jgi:hypothetical protein